MLPGLTFEQVTFAAASDDNRADIACFVGFARLTPAYRAASRAERLARFPDLFVWLSDQGWIDAAGSQSDALVARREAEAYELLQVPVPIDSWGSFESFFEAQSLESGVGANYLGAAVRSFFAQGGQRCYVVRAGDPVSVSAPRSARLESIAALVPSYAHDLAALSPTARYAWRGIAHVLDLEDVAFLSLPDLPSLVAQELVSAPTPNDQPFADDTFGACTHASLLPATLPPSAAGVPVCVDEQAYRDWALVIRAIADFLDTQRRDVQLIASVPLPSQDNPAHTDLLAALLRWGVMDRRVDSTTGLGSALVQLVYPWLRWPGGATLPGGLEPPEGAVAGVLARSTLLSGTFRSAAKARLFEAIAVEPQLSRSQRMRKRPRQQGTQDEVYSLEQRVSLLAETSDGVQLLSDVTTSIDEPYRAAPINRLTSVWVRALRSAARDLVFEPSNAATWELVRKRVRRIGLTLLAEGALQSDAPRGPFAVRCDRSTISSADIDAGRVRAEVEFTSRVPIEVIRVSLALDESQRVSVSSSAGVTS